MSASTGEHARLPAGSVILDRFTVLHELGCGNFAKVYCCRDTKCSTSTDPELVAVKVLKREYANDARYEADVLKAITEKNSDQKHAVLTMNDHFQWGRYPVFVFPLKGPTLRQRRLGVARGSCTAEEVRAFAFEMLRALAFLHFDVKMIHTDLKPENILLDSPSWVGTPAAATTGLGSKWTIADFGSASFYRPEKLDSDLISTRPYRAPEVVLGGSWFYSADVWSMACIIFEVYMGSRLFDVHDDLTHLWQMEARLSPLPPCLTSGQRHSRRFFSSQGNLMARTPSNAPKAVADALRDEPLLCDLLLGMLAFDPQSRTRADKALSHPYFDSATLRSRRSPSMSTSTAPPPTSVEKRRSVSPPGTAAAASHVVEKALVAAPHNRPLPLSRAASPLLPTPTPTTSHASLKYAKLRRGLLCRPTLPPPPSASVVAEAIRL